MKFDYDLAIIGAGASGLIAADFAVTLGARVAMIEKDRIGGDCTWSGCVPSKSLLKAASVAHAVRHAARFGIEAHAEPADMARVRAWLDSTIAQIYAPTTPEALRSKGIDILLGSAAFTGPHTLQAGGRRITAGAFLINTGAAPATPAIDGLQQVEYATYKEIFRNTRLPQRLIVIGGGPVGCEVAQSYRRLGAQVILVAERLLPHEEPEASAILEEVFAGEGVQRLCGRAVKVTSAANEVTVFTDGAQAQGDLLLIATGRTPAVAGLALERAGVNYTARGIAVDAHLRTSARHIYAAGDVLGGPQYSHLAGWQGFQAARNALLPGKSKGVPRCMPRVTFTSPEVAQAGVTEQEARARYGHKLLVKTFALGRVDRAVSEDDSRGMLKLIARPDGKILGGTMVGERASEAITEIVIAVDRGMTVQELAGIVHPYPTYAIGFQFLATAVATERAFAGRTGRLLRSVSRLYR